MAVATGAQFVDLVMVVVVGCLSVLSRFLTVLRLIEPGPFSVSFGQCENSFVSLASLKRITAFCPFAMFGGSAAFCPFPMRDKQPTEHLPSSVLHTTCDFLSPLM